MEGKTTSSGGVALSCGVQRPRAVVIVSANAEWTEVRRIFAGAEYERSPFGEYLHRDDVVVFHGGWGKIGAAASTQYAIDRWDPDAVLNLGTCGGIAGSIGRFATVIATKTVVYDIAELMGDPQAAIDFYSTEIDLDWNGCAFSEEVVRVPLYSADRDLAPEDVASLTLRFGTQAVDWESGAIAWVAKRNNKPVLIVRGVSDLVGPNGGHAYGDIAHFEHGTRRVMKSLFDALPQWLSLVTRCR
jgi:adenosylhomocysteine nucleosidase